MVPAGLYVCAVENQDDLVVTTVAEFEDAYPVVLPVGRSYADLRDGLEFEGSAGAETAGREEDDEEEDDDDEDDHEDGEEDDDPAPTDADDSDGGGNV